jgi:hypothetical protein
VKRRDAEPMVAIEVSARVGVIPTMGKAEAYEHYAIACLELAQRVDDQAMRLKLLEMAQKWRELAQQPSNRAPPPTE